MVKAALIKAPLLNLAKIYRISAGKSIPNQFLIKPYIRPSNPSFCDSFFWGKDGKSLDRIFLPAIMQLIKLSAA
jgi:hypothetical protein